MALGYLMVSRFSQLSVSNHLDAQNHPRPDGIATLYYDDSEVFRRGSCAASTSYGNLSDCAASTSYGNLSDCAAIGNVPANVGTVGEVRPPPLQLLWQGP
ncbi:hypothetical protein MLD38_021511 [Melastoma candidum]|uniref:Uncharacterized protein n=1 Tax=Melastoma candidum TaxID=119954 RepID=A0ACB9QI53_9MYRT|nr:hypothetical protein MLD38_021511 [Melastoma candidum]